MRTLLFMQCFLKHEAQGRLMRTAIRLAERLNPDVDVLLIDNASRIDPRNALGGDWRYLFQIGLPDEGETAALPRAPNGLGRRTIMTFDSAIGHYHYDRHNAVEPRNGPDRAIMTALKVAALSGYDRAAYMEGDALIAKPLSWCFDQMTKPVACQPRISYGYLDWQCWVTHDVQWLVNEYDFPGKYDWPNTKPDWLGGSCGELLYEQVLGEHLQVLPWRAGRGDAIKLVDGTMRERFEEVADSITHCCPSDFATWLEMNGHADLIDGLLNAP